MVPDTVFIDRILRELKESWNIDVSREIVAQQAENMSRKLQIMRDLMEMQKYQFQGYGANITLEKQKKLKSQLIDLSIEDDKIVLDRLSKL